MSSPFPGMDPYIEARGLWEDFHTKLIGEVERALAPALPDRYVVRTGERSYIDYLDPSAGRPSRAPFNPDVALRTVPSSVPAPREQAGAALAEIQAPPLVMRGLIEIEFRETFLEIHELDPERRLVTCIEVLSPSKKHRGSVGWHQYQRKRQVFLEGHANLVELDLLRSAGHLPMEETWPTSPYFLLVLRRERAPQFDVWPASFQQPLPAIPIPLAPPDQDVLLALQPLVDAIYARSRYDRDIDYTTLLQPRLNVEEAAWWNQRLQEWQATKAVTRALDIADSSP